MQPTFVRINHAINFTDEFYEIGKVKDYLQWFENKAKRQDWSGYLKDWDQFILKLHANMENEITQTINTCNHNTQVFMFERLKEWLPYFSKVNKNYIDKIANEYNDRINAEFSNKMDKKGEDFRTPERLKRANGEKYIIKYSRNPFFGAIHKYFPIEKEEINRWYYCVEEKADLINLDFLPEYYSLTEKLFKNFSRIVGYYVKLYDEGKFVSSADIIIEKQRLIIEQHQNLIEAPQELKRKLKFNLSVPQLLYLFKLLYEHNPPLLDVKNKGDLYQFIADNFTTKGSDEKGISLDSIANKFPSPDPTAAKSWVQIFREFITKAGKV